MHLPIMIQEIQTGYLTSILQRSIPIFGPKQITKQKKCHMQGRNTSGKIHFIRLFVVYISDYTR